MFCLQVPDPPRPGHSVGDRVRAVPLIHASRVYDSTAGKKVYKQEPFDAAAFVDAVVAGCGCDAAKPFDAAGAKLLVMDSDLSSLIVTTVIKTPFACIPHYCRGYAKFAWAELS